jgi:hypothetical protein
MKMNAGRLYASHHPSIHRPFLPFSSFSYSIPHTLLIIVKIIILYYLSPSIRSHVTVAYRVYHITSHPSSSSCRFLPFHFMLTTNTIHIISLSCHFMSCHFMLITNTINIISLSTGYYTYY